jgi:hypothetical protein
MKNPLRALLSRKSPKSPRRLTRQARPQLETLEAREVPTVTSHGGPVLSSVQVQALYLGSDWLNNSTYYNQSRTLDNFLGQTVNSSYMDMLHNAGYGVGRGSDYTGAYWNYTLNKTQYLTDSTIQNDLVNALDQGLLLPASTGFLGSNNLYIVFVEDNVAVSATGNGNSQNNFLGYHNSFSSWLYNPYAGSWYSNTLHYAVITYPGGSVGNASRSWLNPLNTMTLSASHELAEGVTDPQVWYDSSTGTWHGTGWHNGTNGNLLGTEIGDLSNAQTVYLNGYAVQREADQNEQAMTPVNARPVNPINFVLDKSGNLYAGSGSNLSWIAGNVASISDQSIDNYGFPMIDVVWTDGHADEYHAGLQYVTGNPWTWMDSGVKMAKAGQGVSYLLYNNGTVQEYKDWGSGSVGSSATKTSLGYMGPVVYVNSIDAGTDRYGVNMMTDVQLDYWGYWSYDGWEFSDSTGPHLLAYGVSTLSAGQQGNIGILYSGGYAYWYNEATGNNFTVGSNVTQFTMGTDENGNAQFDMLNGNGTVTQYSQADGWKSMSIFQSISKAHAGWVDAISYGTAYAEFLGGNQWQWLYNGATAVA